jgi:hypothetical protein
MQSLKVIELLGELRWGAISSAELYEVNGLFEQNIIKSRDFVGTYKNGDKILLSNDLLNSQWKFVAKHKNLLDAYRDAKTQGNVAVIGLFEYGLSLDMTYDPNNINLMNFNRLSLKDLAEAKLWDSYSQWSSPIGDGVGNPDYPQNYDFTGTVQKMIDATVPYYMIQFNTGRKIYLDSEGIKDANTNEIVQLDASLYLEGNWYAGENIEVVGGNKMYLADAVNQIDWETQDLVFLEGTQNEVVFDKFTYENTSLENHMPESIRYSENLNTFVLAQTWTLRNK